MTIRVRDIIPLFRTYQELNLYNVDTNCELAVYTDKDFIPYEYLDWEVVGLQPNDYGGTLVLELGIRPNSGV